MRAWARTIVGITASALLATAAADAKTLRLGSGGLPPQKGNPYFTTATTTYIFFAAMFDALTTIDDQGEVQPWLATEWTTLEPNLWRFKLRPGVTFSNGEPCDAAAVKATFDFLLDPNLTGQSVAQDVEFVKTARVVDPLTVEIETKAPNIFLPRYLAGMYIVPREHFAKVGLEGFSSSPIGSGPFKVDRWEPAKVAFSAFRDSWRAPKIDWLEILALPEATARMQALETGQVDVAINVNPDDLERLKAAGIRFHHRTPNRMWVIALDNIRDDSPFKDPRVRQALNYATNRQAIADTLLGGLTEIASQPATKVAVGYDSSLAPYPYDPDKARALLKEAGREKGFSFLMEIAAGQLANDGAIAQAIARDLAAVGISMEVQAINFPQAISRMSQGGWKGHALQTDFSVAPPLDFLRALARHSCGWSGPWFCDPAIEPKIVEARATFDAGRRTQLSQEINRHYRDVASSLFLFPVVTIDGLSPRVTGWTPWIDNFMFHLAEIKD
ncbi:MAG: hypothetical protein FJX59_00100 [Alphaproteobacteria bacterium]|nr:hypothetical protein [Alphaproteobacteria bacterium]